MKKIIPFTKDLPFQTTISEITDIEITHTLKIEDNIINGSFLVDGKYKINDISVNQEDFNYDLPFTVNVDDRYDLSNAKIMINDFYFEIINEDTLRINIELEINNVEENIKERCYDAEDEKIEEESVIPNEFNDIIESVDLPISELPVDNKEKNITNMFTNLNEEETYKSYYVYIVRENDTVDEIINKYKITKEELEKYNDISKIKIGDKLIIPCSNE